MCNGACLVFGRSQLARSEIAAKCVLEVGSLNVNGSLREYVEDLQPARYVGVDIVNGPGVDELCNANQLIARFGRESYDTVICTEVLEHVRDWRTVVANLKGVLTPGGVLLLTTRSYGFPYHAHPHDYWRFGKDDIKALFSDMRIDAMKDDPSAPGVFLKATATDATSADAPALRPVYSIITGKKSIGISWFATLRFRAVHPISTLLKPAIRRVVPENALRVVRKFRSGANQFERQ